MTNYVTTIGETIYLPESMKGKEGSIEYKATIAHEYIHILDDRNDKLFKIKYLFPQILALFVIPTCFFTWWGLFFLLFLGPIPAVWRKKYEVRGYTMTIASFYLLLKEDGYEDEYIDSQLERLVEFSNSQFISGAYYWMWPFGVEKELEEAVQKIKSGDIFKEGSIYQIGYDTVNSKKYQIYEDSI